MSKDEKKLKAKVDEYFEKYMCVSFDKFIENWEETKEFLLNKDKEIERLNNTINGLDNTIKNLEEVVEHKDNIIDSSIKYLEEHTDKLKTTLVPRIDFSYKYLLNILKGSDKE